MKILNESDKFNASKIALIEAHYNAKFVCETCLKSRGQWLNFPVLVFYTEKAHPQGSNYFAIYFSPSTGELMVTDAISATESFQGILIDDTVVYSRYRHDYRDHYGVFVDGGRDYLRYGGRRIDEAKIVNLQIVKDKLEIVE